MATFRLATRSSAQATKQAEHVGRAIEAAHPGTHVELVFVDTLGDQLADVPLHTIGGQGVFVKEVQRAVLAELADAAVHSAKDLPSNPRDEMANPRDEMASPRDEMANPRDEMANPRDEMASPSDGLELAAFTHRRDPRDALVGCALDDLPSGALVASGSVRRRAQLAAVRPDLRFAELRGNIQTRLAKIPADGAIVMAVAALEILELTDRIAQILDPAQFVPAPGQGCVAIECRTGDAVALDVLAAVDHHASRCAVQAERAFLAELGSGCSLPVGAHASDGRLAGFLADPATGWHQIRTVALPDGQRDGARVAASLARALQTAHRDG